MFNKTLFTIAASSFFPREDKKRLQEAFKNIPSSQREECAASCRRKIAKLYERAEALHASPRSVIAHHLISEQIALRAVLK